MDNQWPTYMFPDEHDNSGGEFHSFTNMQGGGQEFGMQYSAQLQPLTPMNRSQGILPRHNQQMSSGLSHTHSGVDTFPNGVSVSSAPAQATTSPPHVQYYANQQRLYQPLQNMNASFPTLHSSTVPRFYPAGAAASTSQLTVGPMTGQSLGGAPQPGSRGGVQFPHQICDHQNMLRMQHYTNVMPRANFAQHLPNIGQTTDFAPITGVNAMGHGGFDSTIFNSGAASLPGAGPSERDIPMPPAPGPDPIDARPAGSAAPTFECEIDDCGVFLPVNKAIFEAHLHISHGYGAPKRSRAVECRWSSCSCTRQGQCKGRHVGHGWHGEKVLEHIWDVHLAFQDPCSRCGEVRWVHQFSKERHAKSCTGRRPARCRGCSILFKSNVALAGHHELGQCVEAVNGVVVEVVG